MDRVPAASAGAPAGWYEDPIEPGRVRFWDGGAWTGHVTLLEHPSALARLAPPTDPVTSGPGPEVGTRPGDDDDLATNRPGGAARRRADQLRRQRPVGSLLDRFTGADTDERAVRTVAEGREAVGRRLGRLGDDWHVLHAVPVGSEDGVIDHLVIGSGGVYSLSTRSHRDRAVRVSDHAVLVGGDRTDYLPMARFGARLASRLLSDASALRVTVHPVLVLVAARLAVAGRPADVSVLRPTELPTWLRRRPVELTPEAVGALYALARRPSTWRSQATPRSERH